VSAKRRTNCATAGSPAPGDDRLRASLPARRPAGLCISRSLCSSVVLAQMMGRTTRSPAHQCHAPRIRFVALCVGLDTGVRAPSAVIRQARMRRLGGLAATFLKHKLWRIRNTKRRGRISALCSVPQVIDRPMLCVLECGLARLLLVDKTLRSAGVQFNEDESGCCLGSR